MNPYPAHLMSPQERRAELCRLLGPRPDPAPRPTVKRTICDARRKFATLPARPERSCNSDTTENRMTTHDPIPARLAALKTTPTPDLKAQWRELFDTEPPPFNRRYLESRLAYRIQELAYGGLKPETIRRLEALGEQLDGGDITKRRIRADRDRPITGTRLIREWQGVEQIVTVHRRRLRVAGAALPVALRHRPRHHRHALERLGLLRARRTSGGRA